MSVLRENVLKLFSKLSITQLQTKDLEIGIYNNCIDYAIDNKIPLRWESEMFKSLY